SPAGMPAASATQSQTYTMSGLVLSPTSDDGFVTTYQHDLAARVNLISTDTGPLWRADGANEIDASGRVVTEHYANGVTQTYQYDTLGLASRVKIDSTPQQKTLYDVVVQRNGYGAPISITDQDGGQGLDQTASFSYDLGARLTAATMGASTAPSQQYNFTYRYDAL